MTEVAGEVADGMIIHPFSTLPYIESVTMPAIERGIEKSGRSRADFELSYSCFVIIEGMRRNMQKVNRKRSKELPFMDQPRLTRGY